MSENKINDPAMNPADNTKSQHTPEPWVYSVTKKHKEIVASTPHGNTIVRTGVISEDDCGNPECCNTVEHANAKRIVACVNACAGQSIETVKLATAYRDACFKWETEMMKAIGEDGVGSVSKAIKDMKYQLESYENLFTQVKQREVELGLALKDCVERLECHLNYNLEPGKGDRESIEFAKSLIKKE